VLYETGTGSVTFFVTVGYDQAEPTVPKEVFYDHGFRSGADLEWVAKDAAIILSLLLQTGVPPEEMKSVLVRRTDEADGDYPASMLEAMLDEIMKPPAWSKNNDFTQKVNVTK